MTYLQKENYEFYIVKYSPLSKPCVLSAPHIHCYIVYLSYISAYRTALIPQCKAIMNANCVKDSKGLTLFILSALRKSLYVCDRVVHPIHSDSVDKKDITKYIYDFIFLVFINRKQQLSYFVRILFLCPAPNQLQSRGVSPRIVIHLQAVLPYMSAASTLHYHAQLVSVS